MGIKNMADSNKDNVWKMKCCTTLFLKWISNVIHVSVNNPQVFKIALEFYFSFARERLQRHFLITNVSTGIITVYRGQHVGQANFFILVYDAFSDKSFLLFVFVSDDGWFIVCVWNFVGQLNLAIDCNAWYRDIGCTYVCMYSLPCDMLWRHTGMGGVDV
jgi:hypothetical protein